MIYVLSGLALIVVGAVLHWYHRRLANLETVAVGNALDTDNLDERLKALEDEVVTINSSDADAPDPLPDLRRELEALKGRTSALAETVLEHANAFAGIGKLVLSADQEESVRR